MRVDIGGRQFHSMLKCSRRFLDSSQLCKSGCAPSVRLNFFWTEANDPVGAIKRCLIIPCQIIRNCGAAKRSFGQGIIAPSQVSTLCGISCRFCDLARPAGLACTTGNLRRSTMRDLPVAPFCRSLFTCNFRKSELLFPHSIPTRGAYASSRTWGGLRWT